ncbi:hypothetical protein [Pseudomonas oryziphila]|uniref:Zinc ribbon domain-containing protein n=1 Tax=Pseudomonas entomophila TaxID=312306 RepID=A0A3S8ULM5_9PSED|nr:hypothetical protein [Pseudomonas oryziphila]AZL69201.1 hypothetical protein EJA05_16360 [Pseudomonas oryziphila]
MQLAILVVLILILVCISPWVLALAAAAVVAYGVWVVAIGVVFFVIAVGMAWHHGYWARKPVISSESERAIERVNEEFRRKEAEQASATASAPSEPAQAKSIRLIICRSCSAEVEKFSMFCPVCGKKPI